MARLEFTKNTMSVDFLVDWQTPDKYLDAVRAVLGEIEFDPASSEGAQLRVKAKKYYTRHDSCLDHKWSGKTWMCPAYSIIQEMTDMLIAAYIAGNVPEALYMPHTLTTWEPWFQASIKACSAVCFVDELVQWHPGHISELAEVGIHCVQPTYDQRGTAIFYFGPNINKFSEVFKQFGVIK